MGDSIERALEETVPILRAAQRAKILSAEETNDVVRRRRDHEYAVAARGATRSDFLKYAAFERELASVLSKRAEKRKLKKQKAQLVIGKSAARVNLVYSRAVKKFNGDADLWLHYARHCVRTGSTNAAGKVFAKALGYRGDSEEVWLSAVAFHFDTCGDTRGARALAQRALRALPDSINMWKEYFRLEVCFLAKLISRRIAMGLAVSGGADKPSDKSDAKDSEEASANNGSDKENDADVQMSVLDDGVGPESIEDKCAEITEYRTTDGNTGNDIANATTPEEGSLTQKVIQPSINRYDKLSFWDGGIPIAVYRNACKKVRFTSKHRADFWDIAAATPYAPIKFLESLSDVLVQGCPDCIVSRIISVRLAWDLTHSRFRERMGKLGEREESGDTEEETLSRELEQNKHALAKQALDVLSRLKQTLVDANVDKLDEASKNAVLTSIDSFVSVAKTVDQSGATVSQARQLLSQLKSGKLISEAQSHDGEGVQETDEKSDPATWPIEHLALMLVTRKCPLSRQLYDVLKTSVLVPFRGVLQERALCAWISAESNITRLHEICDLLLSLPPVTMASLKAGVGSVLKIWERIHKQARWTQADSDQTILQARKLFKMAIGLPTAKTDVDLWVDYVDFERRIARDSKQAASASWKAMKMLDERNRELFTERQTLRNLAQSRSRDTV